MVKMTIYSEEPTLLWGGGKLEEEEEDEEEVEKRTGRSLVQFCTDVMYTTMVVYLTLHLVHAFL